eukprot:CAMPEP_0114246024 /NCGR_PEP_ID=MMETSP0058-20121206/12227_1 /TAXON_ID=36894 /ORGANISM="Pyramimonas parkeae, CCMP726" /LENGTH=447 /DNA_ID=CAMNT_0001359153 /DNA_START=499 /DNA_END=1842 /DNA_ORIENTATION=-
MVFWACTIYYSVTLLLTKAPSTILRDESSLTATDTEISPLNTAAQQDHFEYPERQTTARLNGGHKQSMYISSTSHGQEDVFSSPWVKVPTVADPDIPYARPSLRAAHHGYEAGQAEVAFPPGPPSPQHPLQHQLRPRASRYEGVTRTNLQAHCVAKVTREERTHWNKPEKRLTSAFFAHNSSHDNADTNKQLELLIPPDAQTVLQSFNWSTCALVGNSGSLTVGNAYGKLIDDHGVVVRLNQAPVAQFAARVGRKTTFRLLNRQWVMGYSNKLTNKYYGDVKWEDLPLERGVTILATRGNMPAFKGLYHQMDEHRKDVKVLRMNFKLFRVVAEALKDYRECMAELPGGGIKFPGGSTPSTGLMATFLLRRECRQLRLFGFGHAPRYLVGGVVHSKYQYYTLKSTERLQGDSVHSFAAELSLLQGLSSAPSSSLFLCSPSGGNRRCQP